MGSRPVLLRNPINLRLFRGGSDPMSPPLAPRMSVNSKVGIFFLSYRAKPYIRVINRSAVEDALARKECV